MAEKTINRMKKNELVAVITGAIDNINTIKQKHDEIIQIRDGLNEGGLLEQIREAHREAAEINSKIVEYNEKIFNDDEESKGIESSVEELIERFRRYHEEIEEARHEMYGYTKKNAEGENIKHDGYITKIRKEFDRYRRKYGELYHTIEELLSGATTVSVSKNFNDKAEEYKKTRKMWEGWIVAIFVSGILYLAYDLTMTPVINNEELIFYFFSRISFAGVLVWLVIFMGNRRAENKKLEESYKHKEVMSKSFTGYKNAIGNLGDDDKVLLTKLMEDLLDAIKKDSSNFLSSKGESHPIVDAVKPSNAGK